MIERLRPRKPAEPSPAAILESQECLCDHVGMLGKAVEALTTSANDLAGTIVKLNSQLESFQTSLKITDGRLDRAECWAHEAVGYPRTQAEIPHYDEIRRDIETARGGYHR